MASDYLMRQIEEMARLCSQVLFAKHTEPLPVFDEQGNVTENGVLYGRLRMLCSAGRVNEAENLLFERLDFSDPSTFPIALEFYQHLNRFSDRELEAWDYSREEIYEGLRDCALEYGVDPQLTEAFRA